jgi:hypothetical protein
MAYFVVYELTSEGKRLTPSLPPRNVVLRQTHPVVWAANPPPAAGAAQVNTALLFWEEIPDDLIPTAERWCGVED